MSTTIIFYYFINGVFKYYFNFVIIDGIYTPDCDPNPRLGALENDKIF